MLVPRGTALDLCRRRRAAQVRARHQHRLRRHRPIVGKVTDERGKPLDGAVISALGGTTAFAVSDKTGQFTLKQLPPGPYLVRVHLRVSSPRAAPWSNVRPSARSASSFTLRREGAADAPRVTEASVGRHRRAGGADAEEPAIATRASWPGACVT